MEVNRLGTTSLHLSQPLFEQVVNNTGSIIYVKDLQSRYLMVNDTYCVLLGLPREAMLGKSTADLYPAETAKELMENDRIVAREKVTRRFQERVQRPDGWHEYDSMKFPIYNDDGELYAIGGISTDVTIQRKAETSLRESEEKFRVAFQSNPLAVNLNRLADGMYLDINESFTNITGYTRDDVIGKSSLVIGIWDDAADRDRLVAGLRESGRVDDLRARFRRRDGRVLMGAMWARVLSIGGEQVILSLTRDITAEVELEEKYRQAQKMEAIGRLAGGVAHDFNNLLIPMLSYAEMMKDTLEQGDRRHEMLDEILHAGTRAANLTRQILAFSRRQVLDMKVVDLGILVTEWNRMIARLLKEDIEVRVSVTPGIRIRADRTQIEQILMNLAVNAGDAMPDGGLLSLTTSEEYLDSTRAGRFADEPVPGRYAVIAVHDSGQGMSAETMQHIFEPFYTTKGQGKGTGLGLATVFGIVRQHHGHIWVYSEPGRGTTFKIYLPLSESAAAEPVAPAGCAKSVTGTETIMVVEDDAHVRDLVCSALRSNSYTVVVPQDAADAVRIVETAGPRERPHLLLTDVIMPGMNGGQLREAVTARDPTLRILFMSGYADEVVVRHGLLEAGVNFLQKPFAVRDLLQKVRAMLDAPAG